MTYCTQSDLEKLIPDASVTLQQMLVNAGALSSFQYLLRGLFKAYVDTPVWQMPADAREHILYGVHTQYPYQRRSHSLYSRLRQLVSRGEDVGGVMVGGGAPVVVQSMTNTDTADVDSTVAQVAALNRAGSEIVRITVDRDESAHRDHGDALGLEVRTALEAVGTRD